MTRINKIIDTMKKDGLTQIIVSDPMSIFYITGRKIECGERLLALYINTNGDCKLIINKLFPQNPDSEIDLVWYNDDQDGVEILSKYINKNVTIGIDKNWPSGFLIRLNEILKDIKTVNSSFIVDNTRLIKDKHEQNLMRESSRLIESKGYGKYFTHRTGHSIGLQDHEAGDVSASNSEIIKVGQCFSVEPGIYIPEKNIGVRIEDLVLITENGCEVLNKFSKEIIVV